MKASSQITGEARASKVQSEVNGRFVRNLGHSRRLVDRPLGDHMTVNSPS